MISTNKICGHCQKKFSVQPWRKSAKFCSKICFFTSHRECPALRKVSRKTCPICKNDFHTYHHKKIFCSARCYGLSTANKPRKDILGYKGAHSWVYKHFIKPEQCELCGTIPLRGVDGRSELHWANKTGKYLRDRSDWLVLCRSCHSKYDRPWNKRERDTMTGRLKG